jgi:hypothetical protein
MASILDLPPELILWIMLYIGQPNKSFRPRAMPSPANGQGYLCPCSEEGYLHIGDLLLYGDSGDIVRYGTSHPYIMDCIDQSRCFEIVDAHVTEQGVVPPLAPTISSAVR